MKCEECLGVIEEYIEDELGEQSFRHAAAHITVCAACASVYEELRRERQIYSRYLLDIEATQALWTTLRAGIEEEKVSTPFLALRELRQHLACIIDIARFSHPRLATLTLIALGITVGTIGYVRSRDTASNLVMIPPADTSSIKAINVQPLTDSSRSVTASGTAPGNVETNVSGTFDHNNNRLLVPGKGMVADRRRRKVLTNLGRERAERANLIYKPTVPRLIPDKLVLEVEPPFTASSSKAVVDVLGIKRGTSAFAYSTTLRHVEQAKLLLRSFRNAHLLENSSAFDITYDKRRSQRLFYQNVVLRRRATKEGDLPVESLLSSLEPILIDIANLPDKPERPDVHSIKERIERKNIFALLQANSAPASLAY